MKDKEFTVPLILGIIASILVIWYFISCAPYKENMDYCDQLKAQKDFITEKYSPGYEKTELLRAIDSLINLKKCNYVGN